MSPEETAEVVVDSLVFDLRQRDDLRQAWDQMDRAVRDEVYATWCRIVADALKPVAEPAA